MIHVPSMFTITQDYFKMHLGESKVKKEEEHVAFMKGKIENHERRLLCFLQLNLFPNRLG